MHGIYDIPLEGIAAQIDAVMTDIGAAAVKTGMLSKPEVIEMVAGKAKEHGFLHLVVDPVMIAKGGASLLREEAKEVLRRVLLPVASLVTPNLPEAEVLTGRPVQTLEDMKDAARSIVEVYGAKAAVVKGGHREGTPVDVLFDGSAFTLLEGVRYETRHTHGTGCTFSAAITAGLAKGRPLQEAVATAKAFITAAISDELGLGGGHGPTNHWAYWKRS